MALEDSVECFNLAWYSEIVLGKGTQYVKMHPKIAFRNLEN
jgi:hypothetical protein